MSDSSPSPNGSAIELPPAVLYDPADDQETPFDHASVGAVVLLLVGEVDRWWAAETAIELSSAWAKDGRRVVLADLFLENPVVHEVAGAENLEGMVDVFLYGASISRSARPVRGRTFYLIPAGTYTTQAAAIYEHSRWPKLVAGFRDADASLLLFVPADVPELASLAPWVSQVMLLGAPHDRAVLAPLMEAGAEVIGLVEPPRAPVFLPFAAIPGPPPPAAPPAIPAESAVAALDAAQDVELHLPPPPVRTPKRGPQLLNVAVYVLLPLFLLAVVAYVVGSVRPELLPRWARSAAPVANETVVTPPRVIAPLPTPRREGEPLNYSVGVISFPSFAGAQRKLASLRARNDGVLYFISPEEIQGILYYKVLAGALPDSAAARGLKERLVTARVITSEDAADDGALIQPTPYAFGLAERPTEIAATAIADSLGARGIPAYGMAVPYSDGSRRWQVYGGAYADSIAAEGMRKLLASARVAPDLVPRVGLRTTPTE